MDLKMSKIVDKKWMLSVIYHTEAVNNIIKFSKENKIKLLPISGAWLCLYHQNLLQASGFDILPEFIVDTDDFNKFAVLVLSNDDYKLRGEELNFNRYSIKMGKEYLYFNVYKNIGERRKYHADLPVKEIWSRAVLNENILVPQFEDGYMSVVWRTYHLLYKNNNPLVFQALKKLLKDVDRQELIKIAGNYNLKRIVKKTIDSSRVPSFKFLSLIKNDGIRKLFTKGLNSDNHLSFISICALKSLSKNLIRATCLFNSWIVNRFAKSYVIKKEIENRENSFQLINRLRSVWRVENNVKGEFLISTSSGLWYLSGKKIRMILPGGCFGITGGPERWYVCQYTGDYSRILEFTLVKKDDNIFLLNRKNYLTGLSPNIHQIDIYNGILYIVSAEDNSLIVSKKAGTYNVVYPNKRIKKGKFGNNHFNSLFVKENTIYLMAHNGASKFEKKSEVYLISRENLKTISTFEINAQKAHNLFFINNKLGFCNSQFGELVINEKPIYKNNEFFLRGVAITDESIIIGGSEFAIRENRQNTSSTLFELTYEGKLKNKLYLKNIGQVYDIRHIGTDYGMSSSKE